MDSFEDEEHNVKRVLPDAGSDSSQNAQNYNTLPSDEESVQPEKVSNHDSAKSENLDDVHLPTKNITAETPNTKNSKSDDDTDSDEDDMKPMSLLTHLGELRRYLTRIVIIILLGFIGCYSIAELLYAFISAPLTAVLPEGSTLIYTAPQGAFFTYLKVSLMASVIFTTPFTFYQIWAFIAPGLYKKEKTAIAPLAICSAFFFIAGVTFCYYMVFPITFTFFVGFTTDMIVPMISVEEYLNFAIKLVLAFGLVFEMPLFSFFLSRLGILKPETMRKHRQYAILGIFIVAAILTPPDIFSQLLMAGPMYLLYEVSIYVAVWAQKKPKKSKTEESGQTEQTEQTEQPKQTDTIKAD